MRNVKGMGRKWKEWEECEGDGKKLKRMRGMRRGWEKDERGWEKGEKRRKKGERGGSKVTEKGKKVKVEEGMVIGM